MARSAERRIPLLAEGAAQHLSLVRAEPEGVADHHWITVGPESTGFLLPLRNAFGVERLRLWVPAAVTAQSFRRSDCDGLVTAAVPGPTGEIAVIWNDFRVNSGTYSRATARRFVAFLEHLGTWEQEQVPLVHVVNSAGLRLMDGRALFSDAFAIWPALLAHAARHPVLTCLVGRCLGLAPLLGGLGHYRVAVAERTQINLTGPEVLSLFFGKALDFDAGAAAERAHDRSDLVHEIVPSVDAALARFRSLLSAAAAPVSVEAGSRIALLDGLLDAPSVELVPGWCRSVRLFVGTRRGRRIGVFINPPGRPENLISVRTLEKYAAGLDLFRALGLPIVSFLDSPGVDPRFEQGDAGNIRQMLAVGERIIRYPHGAMGVVIGRCFGGASTLCFPRVFGGRRAVALRGSRVGVMHESIIARLLAGSPRLLAQWQVVARRQGPGLEDLLADGTVDAVIDADELGGELDHFLAESGAPRRSA